MYTLQSQINIPNDIHSITVSARSSRIFVSNWKNHCVQIFGLDGSFVNVIGGNSMHKFHYGMHVDDASEQLFVPDCDNHRVQVFDQQGRYQRNIVTAEYPRAVCCSIGGDKIFVVGGVPGWFAVYDGRSGNKISEHSGVQLGQNVFGVAWNNMTHEVFVLDELNHRVVVLDEDGKFKRAFGKKGSGNGEFRRPCQLSVDEASGVLFVADIGNDRVQVIRCSDGSHICSMNNLKLDDLCYNFDLQCVYVSCSNCIQVYSTN